MTNENSATTIPNQSSAPELTNSLEDTMLLSNKTNGPLENE
jgi:hypothetical protein